MTTGQLLPNSFPPPPRKVHTNSDFGLSFLRLTSIGFFICVLATIAYMVVVILWGNYGINTIGHVVGIHVSRGKITRYYVDFTYSAPDGLQRDEDRVGAGVYDKIENRRLHGSSDITVRYLVVGPFHFAGLMDFDGIGPRLGQPGMLLLLFSFCAIGNSLVAWVAPAREKMLVRMGIPVFGAITDKRAEVVNMKGRRSSGKKKTCNYIKYVYKNSTGQNCETEMELDDYRRWQAFEIGQVVTVLVHPTKPNRSLIYELRRYCDLAPEF